jgi:hypothetical protein
MNDYKREFSLEAIFLEKVIFHGNVCRTALCKNILVDHFQHKKFFEPTFFPLYMILKIVIVVGSKKFVSDKAKHFYKPTNISSTGRIKISLLHISLFFNDTMASFDVQ